MKTLIVKGLGGRELDLLNPTSEDVEIEELATGLSRLARWGGKTRTGLFAYSVAQHSINVALYVPPQMQLAALLHDAHEAILGADICCPIRRFIELETAAWEDLCRRWDAAITERFGLPSRAFEHPAIRRADMTVRDEEREYLMDATVPEARIPYRMIPWIESTAARHWEARVRELLSVCRETSPCTN